MEHHPHVQQAQPHGGGGGGRLNRLESFAYELIVHRGHNLPKADTFGSIDAYLVITPPDNQGYKFTTKTINNDYNPKWKQTFRWVGPGLDTDTIQVQVWDSDTTSKDDYIGKFTFDASQVPFKKKVFNVQLTSEFDNKRKGSGPSTITLSFGVVPTYQTTKARMLSRGGIIYPNVIFNDQKETIYLNLQPWYLPYYLAVEWETKDYGRRFDLFLLQTSPEKDLSKAQKFTARWGLPAYPSSFKFKVKKSMELCVTKDILPALSIMQDQGNTIFTAYEEAKLDDLPLYAPLYELQIQYGTKKIEWEGDYAEIGSKHGWKGTLTYEQAKQKLTDKHCDDKHKQVFFVEQQGLFKVDWDSGNSDYQFYLYRAMAQAGITMELSHATQKKKHTQTYMDKSKTLFGQEAVMFASIDDLSYPVQLKDIKATAYKLENQQVLYLATLLPLNPYGF